MLGESNFASLPAVEEVLQMSQNGTWGWGGRWTNNTTKVDCPNHLRWLTLAFGEFDRTDEDRSRALDVAASSFVVVGAKRARSKRWNGR